MSIGHDHEAIVRFFVGHMLGGSDFMENARALKSSENGGNGGESNKCSTAANPQLASIFAIILDISSRGKKKLLGDLINAYDHYFLII